MPQFICPSWLSHNHSAVAIQYEELCKHLPTIQSHVVSEDHTLQELIGAVVRPVNILFGFPGITYLNFSNPEFPSIFAMF